ncbi:nucleoid-associated protein [Crocosphaera sp. UHCC 0190]|uniref:nucleoid-associated protein n=1 Tax=Crocosphaera sp. UHCC 0190 TaxID=3110246 RepID=UPI002B20F049|nr:nucleoid-associated protein [Crocosphaera sp. UHCC 0190]MEA5511800.1 nucleoid-associated protein [Crocosphaera sp. UHCC 0190]
MRDSTGIKIKQLIVHSINSRETNGLTLSERCIPLDHPGDLTQRLIDYFVKHIENSLQDPATKAARFKTETFNDAKVPGICRLLLQERFDLVLGSQKIAKSLKDIIDRDKRISLCNLVMCTYQAQNYKNQKFIALMKIDPSDVFRQKIEVDEQNRRYVSFEIENDVMPTTKEKLQKCAFIKSLNPRPEDYDMILLDRQIRQQEEVAQFFTEDFLEVELTLDDRERTKRFHQGGTAAMNEIRSQLTPEQNKAVSSAFESAIRQNKVNVDEVINNLPIDDQCKRIIEEKLSDLPDREFSIDSGYVKNLGKKIYYKGDYGLSISVNFEDHNKVIKKEKPPIDGSNFWEITIRTRKWEEVTK